MRGRLPVSADLGGSADGVARSERFSIPLTPREKADLQTVAKAWGRNQTEFARELLLSGLRALPAPAPKIPLPTPRF